MRVLLIYPPISMWERYSSDIGHSGGRQMPLGIYYLASYLRQSGHAVSVIDAEAQEMSARDLGSKVLMIRPDIVGISSTTVAFHNTLTLAKELKSRTPDLPVVIGGPHATAAAEDVLMHKEIDFAVMGEGESTLNELLDTMTSGGELRSINGLAFRQGNSIVINSPREFIRDLDSIPFPAHDLIEDFSVYNPPPTNYRKLPVASMITSRGCPNRCTFCGHSVFGRSLRQRGPENIAEEITLLYRRYGVREIAFVDDTFTINPRRIEELFRILDRRDIHLPWTCMSRVNTVDEDILRFMKEHGCWHISFGIESGNDAILQRIKKNISLTAVRQVVEACHRIGIHTKGFFIIGHPGETLDTINETIRFALDIPLDDVVVTLNTPMPGTDQYQTAHHFGRLDRTDWARFNMWNPVFIPEGLTEELLLAKHREFYRRFYLRPRIMKRYAASFLSRAGMRRSLSLLRSLPFLIHHKEGRRGKEV